MGGVILLLIMVLLVLLLVTPALRAKFGRSGTPSPGAGGEPPHEVVVHQLDDHRKKKPSPDDAQKPQG